MTFQKKFLTVIMFVCITFAFSACDLASLIPGTPSAKDILSKCEKASSDAKSMKVNLNMDMKISTQGQSMDMKVLSISSVFTKPSKTMTETSITLFAGNPVTTTTQYMETSGNNYVVYTKAADKWSKSTINLDTYKKMFGTANVSDFVKQFASVYKNVELKKSEKLNGTDVNVLVLTISGDKMSSLLNGIMPSLGNNTSLLNIKGLKDLTSTFYIDKSTNLPVKMTMDLTDYMNTIIKYMTQNSSATSSENAQLNNIKYDKVSFELVYSDYNSVKEFTIPTEAKTASEVSISSISITK